MQALLTLDQHIAQIQLKGNFTWEGQRDLKQVTQEALADSGIREFHFDLCDVQSMDSTGLGMLLLLRERAPGHRIVLKNSRAEVRAMLDIANAGGVFHIC